MIILVNRIVKFFLLFLMVVSRLLDYSLLFYEAQRSGKLPANQRITWVCAFLDQKPAHLLFFCPLEKHGLTDRPTQYIFLVRSSLAQ